VGLLRGHVAVLASHPAYSAGWATVR